MLSRKLIDVQRARELFTYEEFTGRVIWRHPQGKACNNDQAGTIPKTPRQKAYRCIRFDGVPYQAHRLIFAIKVGYVPDHIDHINGDGLDNRWANLRECTDTQNNANRRKKAGTASRFKGVSPSRAGRRPWKASICVQGRARIIGTYFTEEEAAAAYRAAALEHFGQFARFD